MRRRRLTICICSITLIIISIITAIDVKMEYKEISAFFNHLFSITPRMITSGYSNVVFSGLFDYVYYFTYSVFSPVFGILGIIFALKWKLVKLTKFLSYVLLVLVGLVQMNAIVSLTTYYDWGWYDFILSLGLAWISIFLFINIRKYKFVEKSGERKKGLLLYVSIIYGLITLIFALTTSVSLYIQNIGKAQREREVQLYNDIREVGLFINEEDIHQFIVNDVFPEKCIYFFENKLNVNINIVSVYLFNPGLYGGKDGFHYIYEHGQTKDIAVGEICLDYKKLASHNTELYKEKTLTVYRDAIPVFVENVYEQEGKKVKTVIGSIKNKSNQIFCLCAIDFYDVDFYDGFDESLISILETIFILGFLVILIFIDLTDRVILKPINVLNKRTKELVSLLSSDIPLFSLPTHNNEIGDLAKTFENIVEETREYIKQVSVLTSENEKIATELSIAKNIQLSLLPKDFVKNERCEVYALMNPSKQVGGDFYDFFMIDDTHLALVIGDVSGKGIPAALFMATGKALIRAVVSANTSLKTSIETVNKLLLDSNEERMFITAFIGVLDLNTGKLEYINAGHVVPYIRKQDGNFEPCPLKINLLLGRFKDIPYQVGEIILDDGDVFYQYTDGVTDATDINGKMLSRTGLCEVLNKHTNDSVKGLLTNAYHDVNEFVGEAEQFDDITMLAVTYAKPKRNGVKVKAVIENYDEIEGYIDGANLQCSTKSKRNIMTIVDEIFRNICNYAYKNTEKGEVFFDVGNIDGRIKLTFIDDGNEFNPIERDKPNFDAHFSTFKNGGIGLFLVKSISDHINYQRLNEQNILEIYVKE